MNPETGLPSYPDGFFDLALIDPPYGKKQGNKSGHGRYKKGKKFTVYDVKKWDNSPPKANYFKELFRVSKHQIIWGGNYFSNHLPCSQGWIFWDKNFSENFSFAAGELAFSSFDRALKKVSVRLSEWVNCVSTSKEAARGNIRIHPTQKPVALYQWLLRNYAQPGDLILDTHTGSASSLIACESLGYNYHAFEIDPDYYAAAKKRMSKGIQKAMFAQVEPSENGQAKQIELCLI